MSERSALAGCEGCGACADEGLGMLPNKRFCGPLGLQKIASVATLALLAGSTLFQRKLPCNCQFLRAILALALFCYYNKPIGISPTLTIMQRKTLLGGHYESIIC